MGDMNLYALRANIYAGSKACLLEVTYRSCHQGPRRLALPAGFTFERKTAQIAAEAALDGLYVVRAFRSLKTVDLHVCPVFHRNAERV